MRSRGPDSHSRRARSEGYPARSVYKLEEIDRRLRLLRPGQAVLDLGCAPGSWLIYIAGKVGPKGRVVGVDRERVRVALPPPALAVEGDVAAMPETPIAFFDVVVSDLAPHTTGDPFVDEQASLALFRAALGIARQRLRKGGSFVCKIFQGGDFGEARRELAATFEETKTMKPRASRAESVEIYLVGLRRR